jgi:hypothetical protein
VRCARDEERGDPLRVSGDYLLDRRQEVEADECIILNNKQVRCGRLERSEAGEVAAPRRPLRIRRIRVGDNLGSGKIRQQTWKEISAARVVLNDNLE